MFAKLENHVGYRREVILCISPMYFLFTCQKLAPSVQPNMCNCFKAEHTIHARRFCHLLICNIPMIKSQKVYRDFDKNPKIFVIDVIPTTKKKIKETIKGILKF